MSRNRALSPDAEARLVEGWASRGTKAMAGELGCSESTVRRAVARLGLRAMGAPPHPVGRQESAPPPPAAGEGRADKLRMLESVLRARLDEAPPGAVASISREYRAVVDELDRMEGGDVDDPFARLADAVASKLRA